MGERYLGIGSAGRAFGASVARLAAALERQEEQKMSEGNPMTESASVAGRDIVERLREYKSMFSEFGPDFSECSKKMGEAADTIDALREALLKARVALGGCYELFTEIRNDWTDPRSECRAGWGLIDTTQKEIDKALTGASRCPHPAKGDPDNTTVRECIERGHCGCDNAKAGERT